MWTERGNIPDRIMKKDCDSIKKRVDILLVGKERGDLNKDPEAYKSAEIIRQGDITKACEQSLRYMDRILADLFKNENGFNCDITQKDPEIRVFFTCYSFGNSAGDDSDKAASVPLKTEKESFDDLVEAIRPKFIICLGKAAYEMVTGKGAKDFFKTQEEMGYPVMGFYKHNVFVPVAGVTDPNARGKYDLKNKKDFLGENYIIEKLWRIMSKAYRIINNDYELIKEAGKRIILYGDGENDIENAIKPRISAIQRAFGLGFFEATFILDFLIELGVVSEDDGLKPRQVLMTEQNMEEEFLKLFAM